MVAEHPQCRFCRTRFLGEEQYGLHLMEAHPYCELCDDDFRDEAEFTEHLRSVSGLLVYAFKTAFRV